jgi:hypothetical protein
MVVTKVSEKISNSIFRIFIKIEAVFSSETLVATHGLTKANNAEHHILSYSIRPNLFANLTCMLCLIMFPSHVSIYLLVKSMS